MKADARRWAEQVRIKSGPKVVLQALVGHMNGRTGRCFPSVATLVRKTALAESTVRAALRDLEGHGLISTTPRRKDGKQTSNHYSLHIGAMPKPIGKRRDALRKAQQRAFQTPMSGGWEEAFSHRNTAAAQPPDFGPEYFTGRAREEGEDGREQPGGERAGDERTRMTTHSTQGEAGDSDPVAHASNLLVSEPTHDVREAGGVVSSKEGHGDFTPWPGDGDALSGVGALSAAREAEEPMLLDTAPPATTASDPPGQPEAEVLAFQRAGTRPWSAADWRAYFDERAGIAEHDGGSSRAEAEHFAFEGCVSEWMEQAAMLSPNPRRSNWNDAALREDARMSGSGGPA